MTLAGCPGNSGLNTDSAVDMTPTVDGGVDTALLDMETQEDAALLADLSIDAAPLDMGLPEDAASPADLGIDAAPPDMAPPEDAVASADLGIDAAPPDAAALAASLEEALPPLFDPEAPDAVEIDQSLAALVTAWQARPKSEEEARRWLTELQEARSGLAGEASADRVVARCRELPLQASYPMLICLRLLSLTESLNSVQWLGELARAPALIEPEGRHLLNPRPQALARQVATWSLGRRAKMGSQMAIDMLLQVVVDPEAPDKRHAIKALYRAMPRVRAQALLRAALPIAEHYRLYEHR